MRPRIQTSCLSAGSHSKKINILSLNVHRLNWDHVEELVLGLSSLHFGVFLLQEVSSWPSSQDARIHKWSLVHTHGAPSALLIPRIYNDIRWTGGFAMHACAVVGNVGCISSYLPDVTKSLE